MSEKVAVVLFNLGGPDSREAIKPFLYNFFTDPNIIRVPNPLRNIIARLIAAKRSKKEAGTAYDRLGGRSPLLPNTQAQSDALESTLNAVGDADYRCFVCMRYWHPMADQVAQAVKLFNPDRVVLLPLYPQYSTTTTRSSYQSWMKACAKIGFEKPTRLVCCYPSEGGFVGASAALIKEAYDRVPNLFGRPRVLFSAHGVPESVINSGDPYQWQCEQSAQIIADALGIPDLDWEICYQSRVGPMQWIGPSTEEALKKAAKDKVAVLVYPHAFVSEHVETLVEIEEEYRHLAEELGVPYFARVPTVSVQQLFIDGLANTVRAYGVRPGVAAAGDVKLCPLKFGECCMVQFGSVNDASLAA